MSEVLPNSQPSPQGYPAEPEEVMCNGQIATLNTTDVILDIGSRTLTKELLLDTCVKAGTDSGRGSLDRSPTEEKTPTLLRHTASEEDLKTVSVEVTPPPGMHTTGPDVVVPADSLIAWLPDVPVKLRLSDKGIQAIQPVSIPTIFHNTVKQIPNHTALAQKRDGEWVKWTYDEYYNDVRCAAKAFIAVGLVEYHGVGIIGFNSPEWFISNLGAIFAGGLAVGIYTTNSPDACQFVAENCQANVIVVENDVQLKKVVKVWDRLPHLHAVVQYNGPLEEKRDNVYTWSDFLDAGKSITDEMLQSRLHNIAPNKCSTLIYTSGTTGNPKGVMLSHDNVTWTANMAGRAACLQYGEELLISYLPLSHIAAQIVDLYCPIVYGGAVWFAQPDALKGSLLTTMREVRPTNFLGVPRVWEKFQEKMMALGAQTTGIRRKFAHWAKGIGLKGNLSLMEGGTTPFGWSIANAVFFKRIRAGLGLDRCKVCISAAAPIMQETLTYFMSLNIPVTEIYGMSESTGPHTVSFVWKYRLGSCGVDLPGCTTKLDKPDAEGNGEICMSGRNVFMGYLHQEPMTREVVDEEGWLHSGDVGKIDEQGFLYITGRIKEILITAGGENVAPVPIEDCVKVECPLVSNAMLIGDKRKFLSMLLTLKTDINADTLEPLDTLTSASQDWCKSVGSDCTTVSSITSTSDDAVFKAIQASIDQVNKRAESNAKRIAKWTILPRDFSVPGGELGPTMKLKRQTVYKMYASTIESFYE